MATFEGKIKHITDVKEFTRSKLIEFVVEEDIPENSTDKKGNKIYPQTAVFTAFDNLIDDVQKFKKGDKVEVLFKYRSRESNGRWWVSLNIDGIEKSMF